MSEEKGKYIVQLISDSDGVFEGFSVIQLFKGLEPKQARQLGRRIEATLPIWKAQQILQSKEQK